jgi:hypothetical protein
MSEVFHSILNMPTPFNMVVMVVLIGGLAGIVKTVATQIRVYGCHRQDTEFKRDMVDRGLSADEIERILAAGSNSNGAPTTVNVGNYVAHGQGDHS